MNISPETLIYQLSVWAVPVLCAITFHEVAHGWVAHWRGDSTAYLLGRTTLNPLKHIDPVGTVLVPIMLLWIGGLLFGWAKPVPVNERLLKNPRRDMALVAIAGPIANFIMALLWTAGLSILPTLNLASNLSQGLMQMCVAGIKINLILGILNCLPLPPLDGSRIMAACLPRRLEYHYSRIEPYGLWITLALLWTGLLHPIILPFYNQGLFLLANLLR
jgi:Zn-dependent protease